MPRPSEEERFLNLIDKQVNHDITADETEELRRITERRKAVNAIPAAEADVEKHRAALAAAEDTLAALRVTAKQNTRPQKKKEHTP